MNCAQAGRLGGLRRVVSVLCLLLPLLCGPHAVQAAVATDADRFGDTRLILPNDPARGVVIMFSDAKGWTDADQAAAVALQGAGAVVIGVDTPAYLAALDRSETDRVCHILSGDAQTRSRLVQRAHDTGSFREPILFGVGQGGAIAAATLLQSPANTIEGAVTVDTSLGLPAKKPACTATIAPLLDPALTARAPAMLPGFWTAAFTGGDGTMPARSTLEQWAHDGTPVSIETVSPGTSEADIALRLIGPHLSAPPSGLSLADELSLIELPAQDASRMAIMISGDGGWRDLDKTVSERLQAAGVSVLGWSALDYFWHARTPDEFGRDLARVLRAYDAKWRPQQVALIGYSFGADVLPFGYNRLPADLRAKVSLIALMGFDTAADFEIHVAGWLGASPSDAALPVLPELRRIHGPLIQCYFGADEDGSACPGLRGEGVALIRMQGGHHFGGDYDGLTRHVLDGMAGRAAGQ